MRRTDAALFAAVCVLLTAAKTASPAAESSTRTAKNPAASTAKAPSSPSSKGPAAGATAKKKTPSRKVARKPAAPKTASPKTASRKTARPGARTAAPKPSTAAQKKLSPRKTTASRASSSRSRSSASRLASAQLRASAVEFVNASLNNSGPERIENSRALIPFFNRLAAGSANGSGEIIRILQFGDSHTAADEWTGALRWLFQSEWGDGGAGFSHAGRPWNSYRRLDVKSSMSRYWTRHGLLTRNEDGLQGLAGTSISTTRAGESVTLRAGAERVEIFYLQQPGGGRLLLFDNGHPVAEFSTAGELGPGVVGLDVEPGEHAFELRTLDRAPVRLFGWVTENRRGVTYETLGINGAQADVILGWNRELLRAFLERRQPALIVIAYGTNEAGSKLWTAESYQEMFSYLLHTIRQAAPQSAILVAGPPDRAYRTRGRWLTHSGVDRIVEAQRSAAAANDCAFWDTRARMGGKGAMDQWVRAALAQYDHVHFTAAGYQRLGEALYRDLIATYRDYMEVRPFLVGHKADGSAEEDH